MSNRSLPFSALDCVAFCLIALSILSILLAGIAPTVHGMLLSLADSFGRSLQGVR